MANVLTDLAADIYKAADVVGREVVGVIPSATINGSESERAAKGDVIRSHFTRTPTVDNTYSPSMSIPEGTDQTVDNKTMVIDQYASVKIPWTGEDIKHVNNGSGYETIYGDQIRQAMRAIVNTIEAYAWGIAYKSASRAVGVAGTTPFGSNFNLVAEARQILVDNGCGVDDGMVSMVLNTAAGTKLRNLAQLQKANEAGSAELLRQGTLLDLQGVMLKESAGIGLHTKGTGTGYLLNDATSAIGDTIIATDTGTGTIIAGDVVTFAGTSHNYIVNTDLSAGSFTIGTPGLRVAETDNDAITVGNSYTPNLVFHKSALEVVVRPPAMPNGGDGARDRMTVQDPRSGLVFEIAVYAGYQKQMIDVSCMYGAKGWKPDNIAVVMG